MSAGPPPPHAAATDAALTPGMTISAAESSSSSSQPQPHRRSSHPHNEAAGMGMGMGVVDALTLRSVGSNNSFGHMAYDAHGLPSRVFSVEGDDAPGSGLGALDEEDDLVDLSYVYLRRDICWWCPNMWLDCCFRKAKLTNAVLKVAPRRPPPVPTSAKRGAMPHTTRAEQRARRKRLREKEREKRRREKEEKARAAAQAAADAAIFMADGGGGGSSSELAPILERRQSGALGGGAYGAAGESKSKSEGDAEEDAEEDVDEEDDEDDEEEEEDCEDDDGTRYKAHPRPVHTHAHAHGHGHGGDAGAAPESEFRVFRLLFLCAITAFAGVLNNIMFVKMGLAMPGYPSFLLYFTTLLYVLVYAGWLCVRRRGEFARHLAEQEQLRAREAQARALQLRREALLQGRAPPPATATATAPVPVPVPASASASASAGGGAAPAAAAAAPVPAAAAAAAAAAVAASSSPSSSSPSGSCTEVTVKVAVAPQSAPEAKPAAVAVAVAAPLPAPLLEGLFSSKMGGYYLLVGLCITFGGACSQYSDAHVSGTLQALINQLTLPITSLFARVLLKHQFTTVEIIGSLVVFVGSVIPVLPPFFQGFFGSGPAAAAEAASGLDSPFWIFVFFLSDIPSAAVNVLEEKVFGAPFFADEIHYLAFTNLITLVGYLAMMPLDKLSPDMDPALDALSTLEIQANAFRCFFGVKSLHPVRGKGHAGHALAGHAYALALAQAQAHGGQAPPGWEYALPPACAEGAWLPVMGFVVCIVLYFYVVAIVVKHESAAFQAVANTLVTPLSTVAFSSVALMGASAQPLTPLTIVAIVVIPLGIVIFKWEDFTKEREENILSLIARH